MLRIAFRVDASLQIGSGHLMRCLALADALRQDGAECHFVSRQQAGDLQELVHERGHTMHPLPHGAPGFVPDASASCPLPRHAAWLGCDWETDAEQTAAILGWLRADWLVVDHYAIDARWHARMAPHYDRLLAIDDLADRPLRCDMLLDQTFARSPSDYRARVPAHCRLLCGAQYALLRPQFHALRESSLARRQNAAVRQILVTLGGVDQNNVTGQVLDALMESGLGHDVRFIVVMGASAPWLTQIRAQAAAMPWPVEVMANVENMAQLMSESDLCIGAAGSTAWERCTLGLPTVMITTAANQSQIASALHEAGAALAIGTSDAADFATRLQAGVRCYTDHPSARLRASAAAAAVADGMGTQRVARYLLSKVYT